MPEQRLITWEELSEVCEHNQGGCFFGHYDGNLVECAKALCPIWSRLPKAKEE